MKDPTLKARLKRLNAELYHLTNAVVHDRPNPRVICASIVECGFDPLVFDQPWDRCAIGTMQCDIGKATITVRWRELSPGRFKIQADAM